MRDSLGKAGDKLPYSVFGLDLREILRTYAVELRNQ
jgi:hypothetical protein